MKIKTLALATLCMGILASCSHKQEGYDYTLNATVDPDFDGSKAMLLNFDTMEPMDSTIVADGQISFSGKIDAPLIVVLTIDGNRQGTIILDAGTTTVVEGEASNALEEKYQVIYDNFKATRDSFYSLVNDEMTQEEMEQLQENYSVVMDSLVNKAIVENIDNPIGYFVLLNEANSMEAEKLEQYLTDYPALTEYQRIGKLKDRIDAKKATSAGKQYTDFSFEYDGNNISLSDYVTPGNYTLVDFWASWCGPCKKEIALIKELYAKYHDKGLNVVGVDVWEDAEQAQAYLEQNPLEWNILFTGKGSDITDIYGINGIPCIILIDPQGNIVARDLFEEELVNTVTNAMEGTAE